MGGQVISPLEYTPKQTQIRHHNLTLDYRGQDRIIQSDLFIEAWRRASEAERKNILKFFSSPDTYKLKRLMLKIMVGGLEQYPISILRQIASHHKIKNYSRMTKGHLLAILNKKGVTDGSKNGK